MRISIIVPVHNEERIVERTLSSLTQTLDKTKLDYEIIVVDDNSDDNTLEVIQIFARNFKKVLIAHITGSKGPTGLGSAIAFGIDYAKGDILVPFMGDMSDSPEDIPRLVSKIEEGFDVVCGSRFIAGGKAIDYPMLKLISHRIYNKFFSFLFGLGLNDFSNAFKAYRKLIFNSIKIESKGFEFNSEVLLKAQIHGFKITEIPVEWKKRIEGTSKLGSFSPSARFILLGLPRIGWNYGKVAIRLYLKFLSVKVTRGHKYKMLACI